MTDTKPESTTLRPLRVILSVLVMLLAVSFFARWYGKQVSMPRYCEDPAQAILYLQKILTEARPAGNAPRRPYIIVAKLLFLVPRKPGEALDHYLKRVGMQIRTDCITN